MNVYICSAARTAIGTYGGTLRDVSAATLGTAAANAAIERAGVDKAAIDEVLFGQVLQGGVGQNVARQVLIGAGLPITTPAMTLNKVCASSMRAISLGTQIIRSGENQMMLVGGCESMSGAPYISRNMRWGARMNDVKLVDMMVYDGVFDVFNQYHMGITAENVAEQYGITREMQDQIGYESQMKAAKAIASTASRMRSFRSKSRRRRKPSYLTPTSTAARRPRSRVWQSCVRHSRRTVPLPQATLPVSTMQALL